MKALSPKEIFSCKLKEIEYHDSSACTFPNMSRSKLLVINTASNVAINVVFNLISLVTLPLFVTYYSSSLYGVFILATGLMDSLALFNFGVGDALMRYTAEYTSDGDRKRYALALTGTILISAVLGLFFSAIMFTMSFFAVSVFNIENVHSQITIDIFRLTAIYIFILVLFRASDSILEGYQMFAWRNLGKIPAILVIMSLYFVVKNYGLDFYSFVTVMMIGRLIPGVINLIIIYTKGLLVGISLHKTRSSNILRSEFFRYSANLFSLQIIAICTFQLDKFVIGTIMSASFVTVYTIITKPMFIIRMVNNQSLAVLGPMFSKKMRMQDTAWVKEILFRGNLAHSLMIYPMVAMLIIFIQPFMDFWMPEFSQYAYWGGIAGLIFLFAPFYSFLIRLLIYTGKVAVVRKINVWTALVNLVISIIGSFFFGIGGVILGSIIQAAVQVPIYIVVAKRIYGLGVKDMFPKEMFINTLFLVVASIGMYFLIHQIILDGLVMFFGMLVGATLGLYSLGIYFLLKKRLLTRPAMGTL